MSDPWATWTEDDLAAAERRRNRLVWLAVAAIGLLVFELTANSSLTVLVGCFKFGWDELQTARRMKRLDPNRVRGRVVSRFMTAFGLWKISLVGVGLMIALAIIGGALQKAGPGAVGPRGNEPPPGFLTACLIGLFGLTLSGLTSFVAVISAWRARVKTWIGRRRNWVGPVLSSALIWVGTPTTLSVLVPLGFLAGPAYPGLTVAVILIGCMGVLPVAILITLGRVAQRIEARSPLECWPELARPTEETADLLLEVRWLIGADDSSRPIAASHRSGSAET